MQIPAFVKSEMQNSEEKTSKLVVGHGRGVNDVGDFANRLPPMGALEKNTQIGSLAAQQANVANQQAQSAVYVIPTSIIDLPDDVKKNIVGYEDLELDEMLTTIIRQHHAPVGADRIIMLLYTQFSKTPLRAKVIARLRLLSKSGAIFKIDGVRSTYSAVRSPSLT